jgi:hypothetical protein
MLVGKPVEKVCKAILEKLGALRRFTSVDQFLPGENHFVALDHAKAHFFDVVHEQRVRQPHLIIRKYFLQCLDGRVVRQATCSRVEGGEAKPDEVTLSLPKEELDALAWLADYGFRLLTAPSDTYRRSIDQLSYVELIQRSPNFKTGSYWS